MIEHFPLMLALVIAIVLLIMLANKIKVAYPVLLVVAGLLINLIPGMPVIHVDPKFIFFIVLPPLLYEAAWAISWKELWRWRRIIFSFAFVVVFLSAMTVAFAANIFIPGFTLALGFLLGGIVSPPDAVSASAILKFVKVPKRMSSILEGESLLNDASSLIIFRFAMITVGTGQFIWQNAALSFGWMMIGGVGTGLIVGLIFMKVHKYFPTDANMDIILTLITPYIMYMVAEEIHGSGVLSVVSGGLLLANNNQRFLNATSRVRAINVWSSLVFLLNGMVFLLIGLDLPEITSNLGNVSLSSAIGYGLLITAVLIVGRIISAYGAVVVTMIMRNFITVADSRNPGFKVPFVLGWTGMRGVVSLAAALSIPAYLDNGQIFPQRNLILFITFIVILTTLIVQGLTLPYIIKKTRLSELEDNLLEEEADRLIHKELSQHSARFVTDKHKKMLEQNASLQLQMEKWVRKSDSDSLEMTVEIKAIYIDVLNEQRRWLLAKNKADEHFDEDIIRKHLHRIDIEEERLNLL
ncbi:MAG TPA: Na+/H+ antiporter [Cyclobacteriaceae bacterium]